jgi:hypothetical protein
MRGKEGGEEEFIRNLQGGKEVKEGGWGEEKEIKEESVSAGAAGGWHCRRGGRQ